MAKTPKNIDLGETYDIVESLPEKPDKHYPSVHLSGKEPYDFCDEGEVVFKFKKRSSSTREVEGKPPIYECTLELRTLVSASCDEDDGDRPNTSTDAEDALDALMAAAKAAKKNS